MSSNIQSIYHIFRLKMNKYKNILNKIIILKYTITTRIWKNILILENFKNSLVTLSRCRHHCSGSGAIASSDEDYHMVMNSISSDSPLHDLCNGSNFVSKNRILLAQMPHKIVVDT